MNLNYPKLSVIMPTYNRAEMMNRAVESLFTQTFQDFEIIVVDDGSTDATANTVLGLQRKSPHELIYLKQENKGAGAARNLGIRQARGDLVIFIDDDVLLTPNLLEEHVEAHKQHIGENIAILGSVIYSPELKFSPFMGWLSNTGIAFGHSREQNGAKLDYRFFCTANLSLKRKFMLEKGVFDENFRQFYDDIELGFRLERQGLQTILNKNAVGYHLRGETLQGFCNRSEEYGKRAVILYQKWPALNASINRSPLNTRTGAIENVQKAVLQVVIPFLRPFLCWLDSHDCAVPVRLYAIMLDYYWRVGYRKGIKSFGK
jgi:GT2 family glycosyltransferase